MKRVYEQIITLLNRHVPEYRYTVAELDKKSVIYIWDDTELIYTIHIDDIVSSSKICNAHTLYRICLIIIEAKIGV